MIPIPIETLFALTLLEYQVFQKESSKIKHNCCHQLNIDMLFSHRVIKMALAHRAQPPFYKEEALALKALEEGGGGHGTKKKYCGYNDHVS